MEVTATGGGNKTKRLGLDLSHKALSRSALPQVLLNSRIELQRFGVNGTEVAVGDHVKAIPRWLSVSCGLLPVWRHLLDFRRAKSEDKGGRMMMIMGTFQVSVALCGGLISNPLGPRGLHFPTITLPKTPRTPRTKDRHPPFSGLWLRACSTSARVSAPMLRSPILLSPSDTAISIHPPVSSSPSFRLLWQRLG
jgi:hypothetical protein